MNPAPLTWKTAAIDTRLKINYISPQSLYNAKKIDFSKGSYYGVLLRKVESFVSDSYSNAPKEDECYVIYLEHPLNDNPDDREELLARELMFIPDPRRILLVKREHYIDKYKSLIVSTTDLEVIHPYLIYKDTHWDPNSGTCSPDTIFKCCMKECSRYIQKKQGYTLCQESSHICCICHLTELNRDYAIDETKCKRFKDILESFSSPQESPNLFKAQVMCCYGATGVLTDPKQNALFKEFAENEHIACPGCIESKYSVTGKVPFRKLESQWRAFRSTLAPMSSSKGKGASDSSRPPSDLPSPHQNVQASNHNFDRVQASNHNFDRVQASNHNFDRVQAPNHNDRDQHGQYGQNGHSSQNTGNRQGPMNANRQGPMNANRQGPMHANSSSNFNPPPSPSAPPSPQYAHPVRYNVLNPNLLQSLDVFIGCPEIKLKDVKTYLEPGISVAGVNSRIMSNLQGSRHIVPNDFKIYCKTQTGTLKELITDEKYYDFMAEYANHKERLDGSKVFDFFQS